MQKLLSLLANQGYRSTKPRQVVLEALTHVPQSVQEIAQRLLDRGHAVDMATIYRTLELFTHLGLTRQTYFADQTARFELVDDTEENHHHHLVCDNCGKVEDVTVNETPLHKQVEHQTKFKINRHILEFFGVCDQCQKA